jgi:hypothetical protein
MFRTFDKPKGLKVDKKCLDPFAEDYSESFDEPSLKLPGKKVVQSSGKDVGYSNLNDFMS